MKTLTATTILFVALTSAFNAHAQPVDAPAAPAVRTKAAPPTLSEEKRAEQRSAAKARFAAMSREEKAANKGNRQRPAKPAALAAPKGST